MADRPERVYPRILASRIRSQLAYPTSFALDLLGQGMAQTIELVAIVVVFAHISSLGGFTRADVLLLYGLSGIAFGLADLAVGQLDDLPRWIRTGEFDVLLLRPLSGFLQLVTSDVQLRRLGRVLVGFGTLVVVLAGAPITWTAGAIVLVVTTPLVGAVLIGAIWVATCAVSFWVVEGRELANAFTYGSTVTTAYPITIFAPWVRDVFCFAVPSAFVAYFPVLALLDRPDPLGLPSFLRYAAPVVAVIAVGIAAVIWRQAVRHYQGAGS